MDSLGRFLSLAGFLAWVLAPAIAHAAAKRSLVIEVSPADDWRATALVTVLTADLADDRLSPREAPACPRPCSDSALRTAGVELVMRAALVAAGEPTLGYELRALWPGAPAPLRGTIALRGLERVGFAAALRDRLHRLARTTKEAGEASDADAAPASGASDRPGASEPPDGSAAGATGPARDQPDIAPDARDAHDVPSVGEVALALGLALFVLATPIMFGAVRSRRLVARAAWWRTLAGVLSLGAVGLVIAATRPSNGDGMLLAAGAVAWGAFAAVTLPVLCPPLVGLGRIDYRELGPILAAWTGLVVLRAIMLALWYAPIALGLVLAGRAAGDALGAVDSALWLALVLPLGLLVARQWLRLVIAVVSERLDTALGAAVGGALTDVRAGRAAGAVAHAALEAAAASVDPAIRDAPGAAAPDAADDAATATGDVADDVVGTAASAAADAAAWNDAVRAYFVGYLRRNGLSLDDDLLDRVTVIPAIGDEICIYGGGATHTRIAIPRPMLELALAPWGRPHDYVAPRVSTLHWSQWNAGLVMAFEPGAVTASREQRRPRVTTTEGDPSENAREHFGEPPTLAGIIEPAALDPRTSYRPHDDPAWLDWDSGEDHDGTDPGDRDFLFGALVHAVAQIQRHGDRPATLALILRRAGRHAARLGRLLERLSEVAGDAHAAIQGARHHLVQYLGWEAWQRDDLLTARAYAPELEAMSRRVIAERGAPSRPVPAAARARDRLARLAGFIDGAALVRARWRRWTVAGAAVVVAGVAAIAVADAVRYHAGHPDPADPASATGANPYPTKQMETQGHGKT